MHKPTHNYHVVVFLGSNPGFCQPDWGSIVGLHDPIRFDSPILIGLVDGVVLVVVVVLSLVLVLSSLSLFFSAKQMRIQFRSRGWVGEYNENIYR